MRARSILVSLLCLWGCGCIVTELEVTNPIPGLSTVAVAPFFNVSHERAVDGRRFALAYFTELQKTPGFQVVPVGVAEQAIYDYGLQMDNPADAVRLAEILDVDAVVVGAVTDYDPYYPPRIGLQVAWYSPYQWPFFPGVQTDPHARRELREAQVAFEDEQAELRKARREALRQARADGEPCPEDGEEDRRKFRIPIPWYVRGQSPEAESHSARGASAGNQPDGADAEGSVPTSSAAGPELRIAQERRYAPPPPLPSAPAPSPPAPGHSPEDVPAPERDESDTGTTPPSPGRTDAPGTVPPTPKAPKAPTQGSQPQLPPIMSYTRMFDGADADLVAALRDYVELSGDRRSGGWEGYLHRSEDFIRFTAHRMILEMLMLHGGEGRRRIVLKHRNVR